MPIFQDEHGLPLKFFIQKDLPQQIQDELGETIAALGGRVEVKVPRQGFILVQQGTTEEERLRSCWTSGDRPERYFVPYSYVEACKVAGVVLKQIFIHDGTPVRMHIHSSIANVNTRGTLSTRISNSGGDPTGSTQSATVILADPDTDSFQHLVKIHQGDPDKYIESWKWVKRCVDRGFLSFTPVVYKNPGGRRPGEERTQFTDEDEQRLCAWIAVKIPFKESGGRTGNRLYQQLCELSTDTEYAWVGRHTWQSWRERYKKNFNRLDAMISALVDENKPVLGGKGQYGYVRQAEAKPKRSKRKRAESSQEYQGTDEGDLPSSLQTTYTSSVHQQYINEIHTGMSSPTSDHLPGMGLHATGSGPLDPAAPCTSPAKEELEDGDDDAEFPVRIGNAPVPQWGKRKAAEHTDGRSPAKKHRSNGLAITYSNAQVGHTGAGVSNALHVIDAGIREIAKDFRFTIEEVQEYYDKFGEMDRTRQRFAKMRLHLTNLEEENLC